MTLPEETIKLVDDIIRNQTKWPEIFGLTEEEILMLMEAVRNHTLIKDSPSYKEWLQMYNGIHHESSFERDCHMWFACFKWAKTREA